MRSGAAISSGVLVLALAWLGPLPAMLQHSFSAHMALHVTVVGLGVPLLALGTMPVFAGRGQGLTPTFAASLLDFMVVWLWHVPSLHHASRSDASVLMLEQASFAAATFLLWSTALAGPALAGAMALFMTSMHMTLLGALLGLAPRTLYHGHATSSGLDPFLDQQLGGMMMMALGGIIYLAAALYLAAQALRPEPKR